MLYDQFGRPIQERDIRSPETRDISVVQVRDRWSSYPSYGLTPQRLARILKEADNGDVVRQAELFEEMEEKDAHLASQLQTRKLSVQGLSWEILPAAEDATSKEIAEFCNFAIDGLPDFDDHILDLLDAISKGYSLTEILWDVSAGQAAIRGLRHVHPKKITFRDSIYPRVLTDDEPIRGIDPPPYKFAYHRYKARSGYDTRAGIMRVCAWMYLFKNYAVKDWVSFSEVYGMPIRVGKYEPGAGKADKDALLSAVRMLGSDAAGIISKATEIEFIETQKGSGSSGQLIYEVLARFCDAQMSKAILGQTLTSEAGGEKGRGSLALGRVHGDVRQDLIEADCRALAKTITHQILRPLVGFNYGWDAPVPCFRFLYEPPEDLEAYAAIYKILCADMGQPVSQEHLSARFKIPLPQPGETPLAPRRAAGPSPKNEPGGKQPGDAAEDIAKLIAKLAASNRDAADIIADQLQDRAMLEMTGMTDRIRDLVDSAASLEEVRDRLIDLYADIDPTRLGEIMQQAFALADLSGRFDAERGRVWTSHLQRS